MIEINIFKSTKKIYIDFAYKGLPKNIPIQNITIITNIIPLNIIDSKICRGRVEIKFDLMVYPASKRDTFLNLSMKIFSFPYNFNSLITEIASFEILYLFKTESVDFSPISLRITLKKRYMNK